MTQSFDIFFELRMNKHNGKAGDLRRHRDHYGVSVMYTVWAMSLLDITVKPLI